MTSYREYVHLIEYIRDILLEDAKNRSPRVVIEQMGESLQYEKWVQAHKEWLIDNRVKKSKADLREEYYRELAVKTKQKRLQKKAVMWDHKE